MEPLARAGWAARAVLYFLVGVIAARIPATGRARKADKTGAFEAVVEAPLGRFLLVGIVAGLVAFAALRLWAAVRGSDEKPTRRLSWVGTAVVYVGLSALAVGVLAGRRGGGGGSEQTFTARVLGWPGGAMLVGAIGLVLLAVAAHAVRKGIKERFLRDIDVDAVPRALRKPVEVIGVVGWLGRAVVWGLVGWFVVRAAVQHDPSEPVGLDASLRQLATDQWGRAVVWVAVVGLVTYGVLCAATARWPDPDS